MFPNNNNDEAIDASPALQIDSLNNSTNTLLKAREEEDDDDDNDDGEQYLAGQYNPPDHLKVLSQPKAVPWNALPPYDYYDDSAGKDSVIYVVDTGADLNYAESSHLKNKPNEKERVRWIWAGPWPATGDKSDGDDLKVKHGTAVLSVLVGNTLGVARNARVVIFRSTSLGLNEYDDQGRPHKVKNARFNENDVDALLRSYDDIMDNNREERIVLTMPWTFEQYNYKKYSDAIRQVSTDLMNAFIALKNVIPVTSAGNRSPDSPIDQYPQKLGETMDELVVVSAVNQQGQNLYQTADWVKAFAMSNQARVVTMDHPIDGSTSVATPIVAGLLAYFMGNGPTEDISQTWNVDYEPHEALEELYQLRHARVPGGKEVVWNGADWRKDPCAPTTAEDAMED